MDGVGSDTGRDYSGIIAGQLNGGTIANVSVTVSGTVSARPYCAAILGAGAWGGSAAINLENCHVRLLPTARLTAEDGKTTNAHVGALVGRGYHNPVTLTDCSIVAEAGATIASSGVNAATQSARDLVRADVEARGEGR